MVHPSIKLCIVSTYVTFAAKIRGSAGERRRRRLDGAEPLLLFLSKKWKCKRIPLSAPVSIRQRFDANKLWFFKKCAQRAQKYLTGGKCGAIMSPSFFICQMRLSRKSSLNEGCRELPGGARQWPGVRWSSFCKQCVERISRHNGCDRYIAEAFQALWKSTRLRSQQGISCEGYAKQSGTTYFYVPVFAGTFCFCIFRPYLDAK